jgi:dihydroflavonol-4-reductase
VTRPVFVTGGSGFLGGALIARLVGEGRTVRALARSDEVAAALAGAGAEAVRGDLADPVSLAEGMRGCDVVFHLAGVNAMCRRDPAPMFSANVEGSANVIRGAARARVDRVVHTSSAAAIGEARDTVGREDSPHRGWFLSRYEESKYLGEREVLALGRELGVDVVCVNPSSVQGPGRTGGSARLLLDLLHGRLPIVDTFVSIVDVADCTEGHLLAATRGVPGERYLLSGVTLQTRHAVALLRTETGRPLQVRRLPRAAASLAGGLGGAAAAVTRRDVPICPELARTLLHGHRYDGSRATRELGLSYTPVRDTIDRTVRWYRSRGLLAWPEVDLSLKTRIGTPEDHEEEP